MSDRTYQIESLLDYDKLILMDIKKKTPLIDIIKKYRLYFQIISTELARLHIIKLYSEFNDTQGIPDDTRKVSQRIQRKVRSISNS